MKSGLRKRVGKVEINTCKQNDLSLCIENMYVIQR